MKTSHDPRSKRARKSTRPAARRLSSVANAVRLLGVFSDDRYELGVTEMAKRLKLAKSTVHRLATTLVATRMLERNSATGAYKPGLAALELGALVRRKLDISIEAKPFLMMLRGKTGETVHLAIPDQAGGIMYVEYLQSHKSIRAPSHVGLKDAFYCTAEGKVITAYRRIDADNVALAPRLEKRTSNTITDAHALEDEFALVRARGYAIDDEENERGVRCIAAPVFDDSGFVIAAIGVAGPVQRVTKKILLSFAPLLISVAQSVSQRMAGASGAP